MADNFYAKYPPTSGGGGSGVTSLNSLTGALTLAAGTGITITPSGGNTLTVANSLTSNGVAGSVQFSDGAGHFDSDAATFFWDNIDKRLLIDGNLIVSKSAINDVAIAGSFTAINDTTVDGSNNAYAIQASTSVTVQAGATNDKAVGIVFTGTRGDSTDNGTLEEVTGITSIIQHQPGPSGLTNTTVSFDSAVITQNGTITDVYHFRGQRIPTGGDVTNHFGVYIKDDTTTPVVNWLSGRTKIGDTFHTLSSVSAALEIGGFTSALVLSRMVTADRDALTPVNGMLLYNAAIDTFQGYADGNWVDLPGGSSGANTTLSNLDSPTAINQDLIPDGVHNLGSADDRWQTGYIADLNDNNDTPSIAVQGRNLYDTGGNLSIDWSTRNLVDSTAANSVDYENRVLLNSFGDEKINWINDSVTIQSSDGTGSGVSGGINIITLDADTTGDINISTGSGSTRGSLSQSAEQISITGNTAVTIAAQDGAGEISTQASTFIQKSENIFEAPTSLDPFIYWKTFYLTPTLTGGEISPIQVDSSLYLDFGDKEIQFEVDYVMRDLTTDATKTGTLKAIISYSATPTAVVTEFNVVQTAAIPYLWSMNVGGDHATLQYTSVGANDVNVIMTIRRAHFNF